MPASPVVTTQQVGCFVNAVTEYRFPVRSITQFVADLLGEITCKGDQSRFFIGHRLWIKSHAGMNSKNRYPREFLPALDDYGRALQRILRAFASHREYIKVRQRLVGTKMDRADFDHEGR